MQDARQPINPHPTNTDPINAELVRALVAEQFPQWAHLPVTAVERQGWDNRSFRLGDEFMVRLPSGDGYVAGLLGEDEVLRQLRGHLPVALPEPVAQGAPSDLFGRPWLVRRHLAGAAPDRVDDLDLGGFARDLASALVALREAPPGVRGGRGTSPSSAVVTRVSGAARCRRCWPTTHSTSTVTGRARSGGRRWARSGRGSRCGSTVISRSATCWCMTAG
ncbi:phosphotransferase [Aestuariimicrobium soli]|uniref:phosphotransferase n=1 Tax=Aestuariimicrobium soli TaxID=2035834 RepID=UPI003EB6CF10